jgi:hypothetical protein
MLLAMIRIETRIAGTLVSNEQLRSAPDGDSQIST